MDSKIYWDILDQKRTDILPLFTDLKNNFYLAGGTALALQLGHRDSVDFDFFCKNSFLTSELTQKVEQIFTGHQVMKTQEAKDTLTFIIDTGIKISFFTYSYELIKQLREEKCFKLASVEDIACMKLSAITSRSVLKDYIDLYFILQRIELGTLLDFVKEKFPTIDTNLILKSLVYFEDIQEEPISYKHNNQVSFETIKEYLLITVKRYLDQNI